MIEVFINPYDQQSSWGHEPLVQRCAYCLEKAEFSNATRRYNCNCEEANKEKELKKELKEAEAKVNKCYAKIEAHQRNNKKKDEITKINYEYELEQAKKKLQEKYRIKD